MVGALILAFTCIVVLVTAHKRRRLRWFADSVVDVIARQTWLLAALLVAIMTWALTSATILYRGGAGPFPSVSFFVSVAGQDVIPSVVLREVHSDYTTYRLVVPESRHPMRVAIVATHLRTHSCIGNEDLDGVFPDQNVNFQPMSANPSVPIPGLSENLSEAKAFKYERRLPALRDSRMPSGLYLDCDFDEAVSRSSFAGRVLSLGTAGLDERPYVDRFLRDRRWTRLGTVRTNFDAISGAENIDLTGGIVEDILTPDERTRLLRYIPSDVQPVK